MNYTYLKTPIGPLLLAGEESGLHAIHFAKDGEAREAKQDWVADAGPLGDAMAQLTEYFAGGRDSFDLALAPAGTVFQKRVWQELCNIPYGETISYGELARRIGNPNAARAVGLANGANPLPIVVPCHRVIGSSGKLVGFGGGLAVKEKLLNLERRQLSMLR